MWRGYGEYEDRTEFFQVGDIPKTIDNSGKDPNTQGRVISMILAHMKKSGSWRNIRREQPQLAGGSPDGGVHATPSGLGQNNPDLSAVYRGRGQMWQRVHIEVDTKLDASCRHQTRIFNADRNSGLVTRGLSGKARGVFFVIDPKNALVTSVRHVSHRKGRGAAYSATGNLCYYARGKTKMGRPDIALVEIEKRYHGGVPVQELLQMNVLVAPVAVSRTTAKHRRQREFEVELELAAEELSLPNREYLASVARELEQELGGESFVRAVASSRPSEPRRARPLRARRRLGKMNTYGSNPGTRRKTLSLLT